MSPIDGIGASRSVHAAGPFCAVKELCARVGLNGGSEVKLILELGVTEDVLAESVLEFD